MHVLLRPAHAELEVRDALEPEADRRAPGRVLVAGFPDTAVGPDAIAVLRHERREMLGADLLLALVEHPDAQRELAHRGAVRLDRLQPRHQVALVVGYAPREEHPVALGRVEGRRFPFVERIRRLYVVVVVYEERSLARAGLADDRRRPAVHTQRFRRNAGLLRARQHHGRGLVDGRALGRDGWQAHKILELVEVQTGVGADMTV